MSGLKAFGIGVLLVVFMLAMGVVNFGCSVFDMGVNSAQDVAKKTLDADNVLHNYEWFKQQNDDFIAVNRKIMQAKKALADFEGSAGNRATWTYSDKDNQARLQANVTGIQAQADDIIATYNARSKMQNRALFKDKNLPAELSYDSIVGGQ